MDILCNIRYNKKKIRAFCIFIGVRKKRGIYLVVGLYFTTFVASLIVLCAILTEHKRTLTIAVAFSFIVMINSLGRFLLAVSTTYEMARFANIMVYVGGCFCPFMAVKILSMLCKMKIPKWVTFVMLSFSFIILLLVLTIGHSPIYYEYCYLVQKDGYSYLEKSYGPTHVIYPILMVTYVGVFISIMITALRKRKEISIRTVISIVILSVVVAASYIIEKVTKSHISIISVGYLMATIFFMHMVSRINMYDLPSNVANTLDSMKEYGYVEFDSKYRVTGYNERIRELFPEVEKKWHIDEKIREDNSFLYKEVILWVLCRKPGEKKTIQVGDEHYEMSVRDIPYNNKPCVGYMLELVDRTGETKYMETMETYNEDLKKEVKRQTEHIAQMRDTMVVGLASMVESRDDSTGDHIKRTYQVMKTFSQHLMYHLDELGLEESFLEMVTRAAPMHDLGKIAIDDAILRKQGRLTAEEYEIMKQHPAEGAKIVSSILTGAEDPKFVEIATNVAHYHHEKWDGTGYPEGLKETEIPLEARLMAFADVFDAMVSKRCYKEGYSYDQVFQFIEESLGSHFDPNLGPYFIACRAELEEMYRKWNEENRDRKMLELEKKPFHHSGEHQCCIS